MSSRLVKLVYSKNLLYSAAIYLMVPWAIWHLVWRGLRYRPYFQRWGERFGLIPEVEAGHVIWVHAVSVGEVRTIVRFVRFLQADYPRSTILVTTMTPTGYAQIEQCLGDSVVHCYVPYDLPGSVRRFLDRAHPDLAFVVETEFWPNIFRLCDERSIPVSLINVRVSPGSFRGYSIFPRFTRTMLRRVSVMAAQSAADAERLCMLGARAADVKVTGNLKFDIEPPAGAIERAAELRRSWGTQRPVWIAASTQEGEEGKVLEAFEIVRRRYPDTLLLLVPRHPERFPQVVKQCRRDGLNVALRSENPAALPEGADVLVGDTMGELAGLYAAADVAFIGGSLIRHGGHNLIEAMAVGVPSVFGPHVFNFEQSSALALASGAAEQVRGAEELADAVCAFIADPERRKRASAAAREVIRRNRGALDATKALVRASRGETVAPLRVTTPAVSASGGIAS